MPQFPDALYTPRTVANRPGVSYDASKTKVFFAEDLNTPNAEIIAIEETLGLNPEGTAMTVGDRLNNIEGDVADLTEDGGWRALAITPVRQSTDDPVFVLRFAGDMTGTLSKGMRLRVTQNGTIRYFIIVLIGSYTGGNTDITVYGGTDYDVNDTSTYPITSPAYSREKAPFGFPLSPLKWSHEVTYTSIATQSTPTAGVWYNLNSVNIVIPIGLWKVQVKSLVMAAAATVCQIYSTLSTGSSTESDEDFTAANENNGGSNRASAVNFIEKVIELSAKTTYYHNCKVGQAGIATLWLRSDEMKTKIRITCAYL